MLLKVTGTKTSLPTPPLCEPSPSTEHSYLVEGYLCETFKAAQGEVVGHGATLGLSVIDIGDKNTEANIIPFMCELLPYSGLPLCFLCLFVAISRWLLTLYPTSVIQAPITFHTKKPHIHFREWGYFWTHKPTPLTPTILTLFTVPTGQSCLHLSIHQSHHLPQYGHFLLSPSIQAICILPSTQTDELMPMCVSTFLG